MRIGSIMVNAAYLGSKVLTAIAVGATKVWEGVSKYIKFKDPAVESLCMKWSSDGIGLTREDAAKVTDIGTTFQGNTEITSFEELKHFKNIKTLGSLSEAGTTGVFNSCSNLESVTLSDSVTTVGARAFTRCIKLKKINIPSSITVLGHFSFAYVPAPMIVNLPNLTKIENYVGVNLMGTWYKSGVTRIESFGNPPYTDSLFDDGKHYGVFGACEDLVYANLDNLEVVGSRFFRGCTSLHTILIPRAIKLNAECFYGCSSLKEIDIPETVTNISYYVVRNCSSLMSIIIRSKLPCVIDPTAFVYTDATIYVPDESVKAYKEATNWSAYADRIKPMSEYVEPTN